ncbi:protein kinase domain-containing protein [Intrasporangium sp.]|uniref:protein kinase domain-containing protein n=1 Tax=Intrasporangium sp. TaxID=1925024 RepID=UPI00293A5B97|nr:protein kinase [Intrasporangium sp.]MDV3219947.1 protein kinase [Intrasporangium sp.]
MAGSRQAAKHGRRGAPPQIPGLVFVQPLGSGGYADVYLYEQQTPRMPVAVKVLKSDGLTDALRSQFVEEADTMAQLGDHPYIVQVFRAGTSDDGRPYLVMKYYPPPNLAMRARAERFTVEEVLRTGIQLASAVETAHRAHITHRDIKPANVLVSAYGAPGLTDFGIAGRGGRDGDVDADSTDDVGVSVPWAAPEVLYGQSNGDERSDVYSLAATLWHLLVGRSPFEVPGGDNSAYALMPRIRSTPPPPTGRPDVPPGLERLLGQALAKDPARRPATALDLARALQAVEQQQRLARTPIVVLDEQGHTTLVSQTQGSPAGPGGSDDDRTRIKSPQTVIAQPDLPSARPDDETRRRPHGRGVAAPLPTTSAGGSWSGSASGRPGTGGPAGAPAPVRPAAVTDPTSSSRTAPLVRDDSDEPTVRRPASPVSPGPARAAPEAGSASARPGPALLWGLVGGVVVLLGVVLFLLLRPEDPGTGTGITAPSPTVSMPGDDNAVLDAVFDPPTLVAESSEGSVTFRWTYPQPAEGDTFRLLVAASQNEVAEASPKVLEKATFTEKVPQGQQRCAVVSVNRGGRESPRSPVQCETAR